MTRTLTAAINIRLSSDDCARMDLLDQKGIKQKDIFLRGLEEYEKDINKQKG